MEAVNCRRWAFPFVYSTGRLFAWLNTRSTSMLQPRTLHNKLLAPMAASFPIQFVLADFIYLMDGNSLTNNSIRLNICMLSNFFKSTLEFGIVEITEFMSRSLHKEQVIWRQVLISPVLLFCINVPHCNYKLIKVR